MTVSLTKLITLNDDSIYHELMSFLKLHFVMYSDFEKFLLSIHKVKPVRFDWTRYNLEELFTQFALCSPHYTPYLEYITALKGGKKDLDTDDILDICYPFVNREDEHLDSPPLSKRLAYHYMQILAPYMKYVSKDALTLSDLIMIATGLHDTNEFSAITTKIKAVFKAKANYTFA